MAPDQDKKQRIAELDRDIEGLRRELQPPANEPRDFSDAGADLNQRQELFAQIEILENERERLRGELGPD